MKTLLLCLCIIITTPLMASDLAKLYPQKLEQAKNIYPLAYEFFKGPGSYSPTDPLTLETITDPKRQQAYYKLRRLIGLAIDADLDLSKLSEFGLIKDQQGYFVDLSINPQWTSIRDISLMLRNPYNLRKISYRLLNRGFTVQDIKKIDQFLRDNDPEVYAATAELDLMLKAAKQLKQRARLENAKFDYLDYVKLHEQSNRQRYLSWQMWTSQLFDLHSKYKQRLLLQVLSETLGYKTMTKYPININYINTFGQGLLTGDTLEIMKGAVNEAIKNAEEYQ